MKFSSKIGVKTHYLSKHAMSIENKFPINSEEQKQYIKTLKLKLKQQRKSLNGSITVSQCITFASYKIAI